MLFCAFTLIMSLTLFAAGEDAAFSTPAPALPHYKKIAVELRSHNGRPTIFLDGKPTALPAYSPEGWNKARFVAAVPRFQKQAMGAYFISPVNVNGDWAGTQFWIGDEISPQPHGTTSPREFASLDEQAEMILAGDPNACLIVRFGIYEPMSWRKLHPGEYFINDAGKPDAAPSMASQVYWDAAARFSAALIQYCESRPWSGQIIGYANFHRQEGSHEPVMGGWLFDHSPPMTARWREFLRVKYGDVDKLRKAYSDPTLTFETAEVPTDALRGPAATVAESLYWQAPAANQPLRDYLELNALLFKQATAKVCQAMLGAMKDRKLIFFDAIKQPLQGWNHAAFFNEATSWNPNFICLNSGSGAIDLAGLLEMPGLDGLITPHDYQARGAGGVFEPEGAVDSAILRGKYFLCEMDTRTYVDRYKAYGIARDDREFAAITWRNFATAFTRGFNAYWMDLSNDWYSTDAMQATISRQVQVIRDSVNWKHETVPGIAMIIDDTAVLETNGRGAVMNDAIMWEVKMGLARCGVPFRIYLLDDLKLADFPHHRVFYFPNLYKVDPQRLALLKEKVFRDGNVVLFGPGSGISDGKTLSTDSARQLTGFEFEKLLPANYPRRALIDNFDHPITAGLSADTVIGGPLAYGPMLFPKDGVSLGRAWTKQGRDYSGLAVKSFGKGARGVCKEPQLLGPGDWASVFTTATPVPAGLWRGLARFGGAHVYSEENDIVLADRSVVAVHSLRSGPKVLTLPGASKVTDLLTGRVLGGRLVQIKFDCVAPQTAVFHVEPAGDESASAVSRPIIRVGIDEGDIEGSDDRALQKAVDQLASLGGGTVNILPGRYLMRNALKLREHVDIVGTPGKTILAVCDGAKSLLAADGDCNERKITLTDPSGFRVGDGVCISDDRQSSGFAVTVATLTEQIDARTFAISLPLYLDYMAFRNASARRLFPVIGGWNVKNVRVEGLTVDGNRNKSEFLDGCRTGGIYLFECQDILIRNCVVRDFNGDAISFQVSDNITVEDCLAEHNAGSGLHPGSGSHHPIVRRNRSIANDTDGIFVCWRVQDGLFEANEFRSNKRDGISIGHKDSDNIFRNNSSIENGSFGVLFRKEAEPMGAHRNLFEGNRILDNGAGAGAAHPPQVIIRGPHHDLVFRQNEIGAKADHASPTIGILATDQADPGTFRLEDNRFLNIETKVKTDK